MALKWKRGDDYHQISECGKWTINKAMSEGQWVYMLVRNPGTIVRVGTLAECREAADSGLPPRTQP